jgi:hypothetical protein
MFQVTVWKNGSAKNDFEAIGFKCANLYSIRKCFVDAEENAAAVGFKIKQEIF